MFNSIVKFKSFRNSHSTNVKSLHFSLFVFWVQFKEAHSCTGPTQATETAQPPKNGEERISCFCRNSSFQYIVHLSLPGKQIYLQLKRGTSSTHVPFPASSYFRPHKTNGIWSQYIWLTSDFLATVTLTIT